uniref:ZP domain-containing protein n=1 Tax=Parastrongyloides trichosuri TaxID=131310 RepID=A0A0N4ZML3_PARTI
MYDIEKYGIGLYLALVSIVIILILLAFCLVGAQESGDPTVAKQLYIDTKSAIENNANLRKISTNFHIGDNCRKKEMRVTFSKMNVLNSTKTLLAPCNKDAVTILNVDECIEEINEDDKNSVFDNNTNSNTNDNDSRFDDIDEEDDYEEVKNNNQTYLVKKHSIYDAIVTVHNNHLNIQ